MLKSVLTTARPPAGTTVFSALDRSNPADWGDPRVGILACSLKNLTWRNSDAGRDDIANADILGKVKR